MIWPGKWLATVPRGVVFDQPSPETPAKPRPRPVAVTPPPSGKADGRRNVSRTPPNKSARPRPAPLSPVQRGGPPEGSVSLVRHNTSSTSVNVVIVNSARLFFFISLKNGFVCLRHPRCIYLQTGVNMLILKKLINCRTK